MAPDVGAEAESREPPGLEPRSESRRRLLRGMGLALGVLGVSAACQYVPTTSADSTATPTPLPTPAPATPLPTPAAPPSPTAASGLSRFLPPSTPSQTLFRAALDVDPDTLDPAGQTSVSTQNIVDYMVETLVRLTPNGSLVPLLAQRWDVSPDGHTYTFSLRSGVSFHDGAPLDATAVRLSLQRFLNPDLKVPLRAPLSGTTVEAVTAVDRTTLRIQLNEPSRFLLPKLASTELGIVSPHHATAFPVQYNDQPVGTGPYRFKEWRQGESVSLQRFEGYWGKKPFYPEVQLRIVGEPATRESLLLADQVDLIVLPPASDLPSLRRNSAVKVLLGDTTRTVFVGMDLTLPGGTPLSIKKARQALNYAVDRESIIRTILFGAAAPMDAPLAPGLVGYTSIGGYGYDAGRAKRLLLEAGTPGLALKLLHPTGPSFQDAQAAQVAQAIAGNLTDVGVKVDLAGYDWPSFLAAVNVPEDRGTAHMHLFSWTPPFADASQQMQLFNRSQWPPQGWNTCHYSNPEVDSRLDGAATQPDEQKRAAMYEGAERLVWDDAPWIFLWVPAFPLVHSASLVNITMQAGEKFSAVYAEPA